MVGFFLFFFWFVFKKRSDFNFFTNYLTLVCWDGGTYEALKQCRKLAYV